MSINKILHKKAFEKIKSANNILLATHMRPDGDAFASVCAIMSFLHDLNKNFTVFCEDKPSFHFAFLPLIERFTSNKNEIDFSEFDLIIVLDCGSMSRTGLAKEINNKNIDQYLIEFDHHPRVDNYADLEIRDSSAAATSEILYDFFKNNNIKINKNIANCILTGILTDTGNFLYPSTSDKTINIASEMLTKGANFNTIMNSTLRNKSLPAIKMWGLAMDSLKINKKYNFAISVLTQDMITKNNVNEEEIEGISGFLSNLYGIKGLVFLREEPNEKIKGSLRTAHNKLDISKLAQVLGGGGHAKASGFMMNGRIKKIKDYYKII